jgi:NitT/TauT family transport system permease protein
MRTIGKWLAIILPPIVVFVVGVWVMQKFLEWRNVPKFLLPRPTDVWIFIRDRHNELFASSWKTAQAALLGFSASAIVGIFIAILLSTSKWIQRAFYPYTVFFQTVPVVVIAPMLVIWFGAGLKSVAVCAFIVSVFPVIANTLAGMLAVDPALRDLFRLYGAKSLAVLFKLRLPSALPNIVIGLRIAAGLAVIGTIVGEFVAGIIEENPGLGIRVIEAEKFGKTDEVFAVVLAASLLGLAMLCAVNIFGYLVLRRWQTQE